MRPSYAILIAVTLSMVWLRVSPAQERQFFRYGAEVEAGAQSDT